MSVLRTDLNAIFVHVTRTAGRSMGEIVGGAGHEDIHFFKTLLDRGLIPGKSFDDFYSFAFVRHPLDRVVSWYFFLGGNEDGFKDYVKNGMPGVPLKPQREYLCDQNGNILVDFVGRFESLDRDWGIVKNALKITKDLPHTNSTNHNHYLTYYDDETKKIVLDLFKKDMEIFEYE